MKGEEERVETPKKPQIPPDDISKEDESQKDEENE